MLTIIFSVSLFVIAGMISYKLWELRFEKKLFICRLISRADFAVEGKIQKVSCMLVNKKTKGKEFINSLPHRVLDKVALLKQKIDNKYDNFFVAVKGKYTLKNKGSASLFLRNISEEKKSFAKGNK